LFPTKIKFDSESFFKMKFFAVLTTALVAIVSTVASQCAYYPAMGAQMQQFQLALQAQMDALAGISGWNTPALQAQYMNQLSALNNQLGAAVQNFQNSLTGYPGCTWDGNPFSFYATGIYDAWNAQQQYWPQLQAMVNAQAAWNPSAAIGYATSIQQQQAAMVRNAQAIQAAWGSPYAAAFGNPVWNCYW
jgi:hypothetical protein